MTLLRSMLFVPGDSERKMEKSDESPADALIFDLEDSVAADRTALARDMTREHLRNRPDRGKRQLWVRINPLDTDKALPDLAGIMPGAPDGIVLPKIETGADITRLCHYLSAFETAQSLLVDRLILCLGERRGMQPPGPITGTLTWGHRANKTAPVYVLQATCGYLWTKHSNGF